MKTLLSLFLLAIVWQGCTKNNVPPVTPDPKVPGSWKITSLIDNNGRDRTSRYSAYNFDFLDSGELQVKQGTTVVKKGTWSTGSSYWTTTIVIKISGVLPEEDLGDLNEDWRIITKSDTRVDVQNGGGKKLTFAK
ncbi:hypothetical protein J2I47_11890 [Fibrella sp. HMF5335]|uniref:Lipocalin-like domain-containing protein n=1 Tax=Fibrella rubiginis TaxID=2817060 RepID=A0A939GIV9_9BACT|nr:hypothetical protein [Fibrella rubiginis]MBO0937248.1 hypothetical protein [Fibrella rubiginis]